MFFSRKSEKELLENAENGVEIKTPTARLWQRFRKNRMAFGAMRILYILVFVAIFADFIANEKPLYCQLEETTYFPVFHEVGENLGILKAYKNMPSGTWAKKDYDAVIFPPIPYSASRTSLMASDISPFETQKVKSLRWRHWLGTDGLGRDLLAGLIAGTRKALLVGLIAMSIALFIGVVLGSIAGYFGDSSYKMSWSRLIFVVLGFLLGIYYGFSLRWFALSEGGKTGNFGWEIFKGIGIFIVILMIFNQIGKLIERLPNFKKQINIPIDILVMRLIEIFNSIPALLLLLSIVAILEKKSIIYVMVIIGLISWTSIARFTRSEMLRIRNLGYIESAKALGYSNFRIIFRHALPNALTPILITTAFGIAAAILAEATLSFLNIGIGETEITWGKLLADARGNFKAWWLAIFPGLAIFVTVTIFNLIGEGLTDAIDARK